MKMRKIFTLENRYQFEFCDSRWFANGGSKALPPLVVSLFAATDIRVVKVQKLGQPLF
jgi:hypothetical protein